MKKSKVDFSNKEGKKLVGYLDSPITGKPKQYAIFAHCFTCNKNLKAVSNISNALTQSGFGVLRFDFTGLGESEGDFADTDFSGNVEDLIAASDFLKANYQAPTLLIGHSLGGAAAILAAAKIESIKAVATIGAPSEPEHVKHLFQDSLEVINRNGKAKVMLEGRPFTIKKEFVDDLLNHTLLKELRQLRKSILILHSPQDNIVGIKNAESLYTAAFHPKSFISLDGSDHLLTNQKDAIYVGKIIGEWASRYLPVAENNEVESSNQVAASLDTTTLFTTLMKLGNHNFMADEPKTFGGQDLGPSPYEYLSGALAACKSMTMQMYARRKNWDLSNVVVHIDHSKQHALDCENCEDKNAKIDTFNCTIELEGNLTEEQKLRLLEISERCPVHKTLQSEIQIIGNLKE